MRRSFGLSDAAEFWFEWFMLYRALFDAHCGSCIVGSSNFCSQQRRARTEAECCSCFCGFGASYYSRHAVLHVGSAWIFLFLLLMNALNTLFICSPGLESVWLRVRAVSSSPHWLVSRQLWCVSAIDFVSRHSDCPTVARTKHGLLFLLGVWYLLRRRAPAVDSPTLDGYVSYLPYWLCRAEIHTCRCLLRLVIFWTSWWWQTRVFIPLRWRDLLLTGPPVRSPSLTLSWGKLSMVTTL